MKTLLQMQNVKEDENFDSLVFTSLLEYLRKETKDEDSHKLRRTLYALKKKNIGNDSILIADDSVHVHYYIASYLTELGYSIADYAKNGLQAVTFFEALNPSLVTMDCTMPVMSGLEAGKRIIEKNPEAKILFITGLGESPQFLETLSGRFKENSYKVLTKPFKKEELKDSVAELLKKKN